MTAKDVIVLGVGGVGSAALFELARRGVAALGIDRFPPGHDRGSSHGESRIIRRAYMEHPDYVPLLGRAYELWRDFEARRGERLYEPLGLLQVGPPGGRVIEGVLRSARTHGLDVEELDRSEVAARFPAFRLETGERAVFERDAGLLHVEKAVKAFAEEAVREGAELMAGEEIRSWRTDRGGVEVTTERGVYRARMLAVTCGAWAGRMLADLGLRLEVRRKHLYWFETHDPACEARNGCPAFLFETAEGLFYGAPVLEGGWGFKAAEHTGGKAVSNPLADPRSLDPGDLERVRAFLARRIPGAGPELLRHAVCWYTMTPDEHFIVGLHPRAPNVALACGLSGHGFKFAPVIAEALADLLLEGKTELPAGFLSPLREGLKR